MDQQVLASHFSNDFSGSHRKDADLLDRMRKKYSNLPSSTTLDTVTPTPQRRASASARSRQEDTDWEQRALQGIRTKELSLDRQWSELSWKQKSTCNERLKLLKDDGVDVLPLLGFKISSDAIVRAVMAQIDQRKRQRSSKACAQPAVNGNTTLLQPSGQAHNSSPATLDPRFNNLEYRPLSTQPPKRKRSAIFAADDVDPTEPHTIADKDEPAFKKRCTMDIRLSNDTTTEEETPTWDILRSKVLRDLHAPLNPTVAKQTATSRIAIFFPSQSTVPTVATSLVLNSSGYDNIMADLQLLGGPEDDDGNFGILDPLTGRLTRVITSESRRTIIEGDSEFLISLIARFRTPGKGLLHIARRYFDEHGVRQGTGQAFELASGTHGELGAIEEGLRKGKESGEEVELDVTWKYVGKTGKWPAVMY